MTEDPLSKLKKHMENIERLHSVKATDGATISQYVPLEVWKLTNEVYTETLREIYDMLHQMNMDKGFSMEMNIGDVHVHLVGDSKDREDITKKGQEIIADVFDRITKLGDAAVKLIAAREKEKRKLDESNRGYE